LGWDKKFVKKLEATIEILFEQAEIVSHPLLHLVLLFDEAPIDSSKFLNEHNLKVGEFRVGLVEAAVQVIEALVVGVQFVSNLVKGFGGFGIHDLSIPQSGASWSEHPVNFGDQIFASTDGFSFSMEPAIGIAGKVVPLRPTC
jgi:hypothetical protein